MEISRIEGVHCATGESPTWNAAEEAWYWVDIPARRVWRLDHASGAARHWEAPEMVACVAAAADGSLVAGMETGIFRLVLGEDGKRLAKREGAFALAELRERGLPPERVVGLLAAWSGLGDGSPVSAAADVPTMT